VKHETIRNRFEEFLRERGLKLTAQRRRVFERAFATHEHFSAERLYEWMRADEGLTVSRATVYRTLSLLAEGGFVESLDPGGGELVYEHVLGHAHHDHLICVVCGRIEEFHEERIEALQEEVASKRGFELTQHSLRLMGFCPTCARERRRRKDSATHREQSQSSVGGDS
jgi:Fur family ferric uptake transcriptional regulator